MVIPRTFVDKAVIPTPKGWRVTVWRRPRDTIFSKAHYHYFPSEDDARNYQRTLWREGNLTETGKKAKYTTKSVLWVSDDLTLTKAYANLPSVTSIVQDEQLKVWVDGVQIAEIVAKNPLTGLKAQIAAHPLGECLLAKVCYLCRRLPQINLIAGTLTHNHSDCVSRFRIDPDPLTPTAVQVAIWNNKIADRFIAAEAIPLLRPDLMVLDVIDYPSETERVKKLSKIENLSFDK